MALVIASGDFQLLRWVKRATAMILTADDENMWRFTNLTRNDLCDLCTVTPSWFDDRSSSEARLAKDGPGWFTSWATKLSGNGIPLAL